MYNQIAAVSSAASKMLFNYSIPLTGTAWIIGIALSLIIIYLLYGTTLSIIADKAGVKHGWRAWVPLANLFLEFDIAEIRYVYLIGLLIVGFLISALHLTNGSGFIEIILGMYLWSRICARFGKSPWLGIIGGLPLIGLLLQIYLAFQPKIVAPAIISDAEVHKNIKLLPVDMGIFNYIKNAISQKKDKEQIFTELQSSKLTREQFDAAYAQAEKEIGTPK